MSKPRIRFELPARDSLSVRTAAVIRKALQEGAWGRELPGERRLCELLHVSRPILRASLLRLAKEGQIKIRQGCRTRILTPAGKAPPKSQIIGIITQRPLSRLPQTAFHALSDMRAHLAEQGLATETFVCAPGSTATVSRRIAEFVRQQHVSCCALLSVRRETQQWFVDHPVPALLIGSCHHSIRLPSIAVDYELVCRHAAGVFLRKGHVRLALVVPSSGVAGDAASEAGFLSATGPRATGDRPIATIVRHDGTPRDITVRLDALFASRAAPTALLVARPANVFAVLVYLLRRGLAVPGRISLISRDPDPMFEATDPIVAHYQYDSAALGARLSRLMLKLARDGTLPVQPNLIFPKFIAGGTVSAMSR